MNPSKVVAQAMAKPSKKGKAAKRERRERRFLPRATAPTGVVAALGALGALGMGAGAFEQFGHGMFDLEGTPLKFAPWILAGGSLLTGVAIWIGTSGEAPLRVGDPGIATERNGVRRMPWYAVERIAAFGAALKVTGKDEHGTPLTIVASQKSQPQAAAWILKEARTRIPAVVEVAEGALDLPEPRADAAELLTADPAQVVGKHCAASGKIIAYEPDARVCPRCERVYHREHVPATCACGFALTGGKSSPRVDDASEGALAGSSQES